jgi:hypothetical protein
MGGGIPADLPILLDGVCDFGGGGGGIGDGVTTRRISIMNIPV